MPKKRKRSALRRAREVIDATVDSLQANGKLTNRSKPPRYQIGGKPAVKIKRPINLPRKI